MSRKTFNVEVFKHDVNNLLSESECSSDIRMGYILLLEKLLHQTSNYKGFGYLKSNEVPIGSLPGIHWDNGKPIFENTDRTRVHYY